MSPKYSSEQIQQLMDNWMSKEKTEDFKGCFKKKKKKSFPVSPGYFFKITSSNTSYLLF